MAVIQVVANQAGAGKTCLIGALMSLFAEQGRRAGYYKPLSTVPDNDADVSFVSQQLLSDSGLPQIPPPHRLPDAGTDIASDSQLSQYIREAATALEGVAGTVLAEGPDLALPEGQSSPLAPEVASLMDARTLLILQYRQGLDAATALTLAEALGDRLVGLVINFSPLYRKRELDQNLLRPLRDAGVPVLGAVPEDRFMLSVTVQQIADHVGGRWVQEPVSTEACVDRFLIGGNIMDSGPTYFGRYPNQAVITRAERPDIQMASLMCETKCLVLTGGADPTEYVRVEAANRGVPMISVGMDTMSTAESLSGLLEKANTYSRHKTQRFLELMRAHVDVGSLAEVLG